MDDMPVYLFTGFLESGKTSFIDETLADKRFNNGQRTLLLVCEEGETEYDESRPYMKNIYVENIEDEDELTSETLDILAKKHRASRVLIEYNGMWQLKTLYDNMPENGKWYTMRLSVAYKWHKLYGRKGPVLTLQNIEPAEAPAQPVATFY